MLKHENMQSTQFKGLPQSFLLFYLNPLGTYLNGGNQNKTVGFSAGGDELCVSFPTFFF